MPHEPLGTLPEDAADDRSKTAAAMIFNQAGRVLLIREGYGRHRYGLPGGALKVGESPQEAVLRETAEETTLRVRIVRTVGRYVFTGAVEFISFVYLCAIVDGVPTLPDTGEIAEIGWFDPAALPTPLTYLAPVAIPDAVVQRSGVNRTTHVGEASE